MALRTRRHLIFVKTEVRKRHFYVNLTCIIHDCSHCVLLMHPWLLQTVTLLLQTTTFKNFQDGCWGPYLVEGTARLGGLGCGWWGWQGRNFLWCVYIQLKCNNSLGFTGIPCVAYLNDIGIKDLKLVLEINSWHK